MKEARDEAAAAGIANQQRRYGDAMARTQAALHRLGKEVAPEFLLDLNLELGLALHGLGRDEEAEYELRLAMGRDSGLSTERRVREAVLALSEIDLADGRLYEADQLANSALFATDSLNGADPMYHIRVLLQVAATDRAMHFLAVANWRLLQAQDLLDGQPDTPDFRQQRFLCKSGLTRVAMDAQDEAASLPLLKVLRESAATADERREAELLVLEHDRDLLLLKGDYAAAIARTGALAAAEQSEDMRTSHFIQAQRETDRAQIYFESHDDVHAVSSFREAIRQDRLAFATDYLLMNESQRHQFATESSTLMARFLSFCLATQASDRQRLLSDAYSLVLWQKNMVSASLRAEASTIAQSQDAQLRSIAADLQTKRTELAELLRSAPTDPQIASRSQQVDAAERHLAQLMQQQGFMPEDGLDQVLSSLTQEDAAVEIVVFPEWDREGSTRRTLYCALIVTPGKNRRIELISLGDAAHVEDDQLKLRRLTYPSVAQEDIDAYRGDTWHPLERVLAQARRIYLSPDGVLSASPFFLWKHSDGRFLIDHKEIDLRPVFSTAELAAPRVAESRDAILLGDPDYDLGEQKQPAPSSTVVQSWRDLIGGRAERLPASRSEVKGIYEKLHDQGFSGPEPLVGTAANKSALLNVDHPYVLHVATHGYFWRSSKSGLEIDPNGLEAALQQSGLLLAGANKAISAPEATMLPGDGILTAAEIAGMHLGGTDLVVLSACDSGLGQESFASGSLGLRRALHIAGAAEVLVSMWEVESLSTADLMQRFYAKWTGGIDRYQALREAAESIREQPGHSAPYYWAPFVLFGY